ncbi:MAG: hypothetical protein JW873_02920 [Candidatus Saganbacteria bacterium]|nr:hypothetical protein [Candidatus Saganbacteria bacterium]
MTFNSAFRLAPLPAGKQVMKQAFLERARAAQYKNYRSPWIPVTDANRARLQKGDLIINAAGLEDVHGEPRPLNLVENGEIKKQIISKDERRRLPRLVWVDSPAEQRAHLEHNPFRRVHELYSREVAGLLKASASRGRNLVAEVAFPIFHETSLGNAGDLLKNGINYLDVWGRRSPLFGYCFYAGRERGTTSGRGMQQGAVVEILAAPDLPARTVDFTSFLPAVDLCAFIIYPGNYDRDNLLPMVSGKTGGANVYWLSSFCAELGASSLSDERSVYIFDSFEAYRPARII